MPDLSKEAELEHEGGFMKVYVVRKVHYYEGFVIHGIYSTKDAAEREVKKLKMTKHSADEIDFEEWEVEE